ncbi:MAG: N-acetylmuramoyl-L-alanine amidase [Candidatus Riflebacteria bacterium]|nr:N-acetylmuramoyl-L-alanine amidase [Candidatus Riflebacteria bacterium]
MGAAPARALALVLLLWTASAATASILRDASFDDSPREAVLTMMFDSEPPIRYTPMADSRVLILDFQNAVFPKGTGRFTPRARLVEYLSLIQFNRDRLRMVLKVSPGTIVNVYRYPVPGRRDVRFAVVVEPETALERLPMVAGRKTRPRIVLDPGHGGHDSGAIGTLTSDKEVALGIAHELRRLFEAEPRVETFYTRLADHFIPLEDRSHFARRIDADAFVSLHANMMVRDSWTRGVEVWYLSQKGANKELERVLQEKGILPVRGRYTRRPPVRSGDVDQIILSMQQAKTVSQSSLLARIINRNLMRYTGQESRGVKRGNFKVLRPIEVPACLVEFGFLSNFQDERLMTTRAYQKKAAAAVYHGIMEWMARTGRIQGPQASGLIHAEVSVDEVGEASAAALESEAGGERVALGGAVNVARARSRLKSSRRR